jgi:DNA-binding response OmpR family regulator
VFVCEDYDALRAAICSQLVQAGYTVASAGSGEACLGRCRVWEPDVVVLDLSLSDRSGLDVLRALRRERRLSEVRVIVLGGEREAEPDALLAGADDFLLKPASMDELFAAVDAQLASDQPIGRAGLEEQLTRRRRESRTAV